MEKKNQVYRSQWRIQEASISGKFLFKKYIPAVGYEYNYIV